MGNRRRWVSVLSVGLLGGLLTACSGGGGAASSGPAGGASAVVATPAAGGGDGGPTGSTVEAGDDLCRLLDVGDWAMVGVTDAQPVSENNLPPEAYYCVYRGKSSATGGLELDAFISPTAEDAAAAMPEAFGEFMLSSNAPVTVAGADEAALSLPSSAASTDPAVIAVRKGRFSFLLGMGSSFGSAQQDGQRLQQLAALVMTRAAALGE
jgi:hypothetical protein